MMQTPPTAHRDLKFENVLIAADGSLRLCDFGSASTFAGVLRDKKERLDQVRARRWRGESCTSTRTRRRARATCVTSDVGHACAPGDRLCSALRKAYEPHRCGSLPNTASRHPRPAPPRPAQQEDAITRFTTPHFRAPEMVDLYSDLPLDTRVDVWVRARVCVCARGASGASHHARTDLAL